MTDAADNLKLATETANALLAEIQRGAEGATDRGADFIRELAQAYALVRDAMPKPKEHSGRHSLIPEQWRQPVRSCPVRSMFFRNLSVARAILEMSYVGRQGAFDLLGAEGGA